MMKDNSPAPKPIPTPAPSPAAINGIKGIDVSHHNSCDFKQVLAGGYLFAFLKCSQRADYIDPMFAKRWPQARAAGIKRGAYHFFQADHDGTAQAAFFWKVIASAGGLEKADLPPVIDWEQINDTPRDLHLSRARDFLVEITRLSGRHPIIYTGSAVSDIAEHVRATPEFAHYPLWVADYGGLKQPRIPHPWDNFTFWQFTGDGVGPKENVPSVSDSCDVNIFAGTMEDLNRL